METVSRVVLQHFVMHAIGVLGSDNCKRVARKGLSDVEGVRQELPSFASSSDRVTVD